MKIENLKKIWKEEKYKILIYLFFVALFLVLCLVQINKHLILEDVYFTYIARGIINTGKPIMNYAGYNLPSVLGLAHPPLYVYFLALFIKLFGYAIFSLKFVNILFTIFTSLVVFIFAKKVYPKFKYLGLIASGIYLIHSFTIQSALLLDIDGGILTFFTALSLLYFTKYKLNRPFILGLLLFLVIITKFTSIIILFGVFFIYLLFFEGNKGKNLVKLIRIFAAVVFVFLLFFYIYSQVAGVDFYKPFSQNTFEKFSGRGSEGVFKSIMRTGYSLKNLVIWLTPPLALYLLIILFMGIKGIIKKKLDKENKIYFLFFIITILFFALIGVEHLTFAKHYIIILPILSIVLAKDIEENKSKINRAEVIVMLLAMFIIFNYYILIIKDPFFTPDNWMVFQNFDYGVILKIFLKIFLILLPALPLFFIFKYKARKALVICFFAFIIYSSLYTASVSYSTTVYYGNTKLDETVSYVENLTEGKEATIIALNDFVFVYNKGGDFSEINNNAYMYSAWHYYIYGEEFFKQIKITPGNTYLIIYEHETYRKQGVREHLENNFMLLKQIGYYQIWKYKF